MTVVERFLKLVSYPTTSDEASETCPSTARQFTLAQELVRQMQDMGIADAHVDKDGYVYGTVPANCEKDIPVYGLIAHMDTSPDAPGENIRARITEPYDGGDIVLNEEKHIMLSPKEYPQLKNSVGKRLIVTDGTTLLGADDKAGVAEIMSAVEYLLQHPELPHGRIAVGFSGFEVQPTVYGLQNLAALGDVGINRPTFSRISLCGRSFGSGCGIRSVVDLLNLACQSLQFSIRQRHRERSPPTAAHAGQRQRCCQRSGYSFLLFH